MDYIIREMKQSEYPLLEDFLYHAIFLPPEFEGVLPRSIIHNPDLWRTIDGFGTLKDDCCLVAEAEGRVVGAVWVRIADQYGHLDDETPSFSISLRPDWRGRGIGTALMRAMLARLNAAGYPRASLSVQKRNYAVGMYLGLGFEIVAETDEEYIMLHRLSSL